MAYFKHYKITSSSIILTFSVFGFSKDVKLDFIADKNKIEKVKSIVSRAIASSDDLDDTYLDFEYDGYEIEARIDLCRKCLHDLEHLNK